VQRVHRACGLDIAGLVLGQRDLAQQRDGVRGLLADPYRRRRVTLARQGVSVRRAASRALSSTVARYHQ